jgi:pilus assembly protein CpaB
VLLAVTLGLIGAALVYVAFSRGGGSSGGSVADTAVVVAKAEIPARTKITASMVDVRLVPADAVSEFGYTETQAVVGQITRFPIAANEQVLSTKIVALNNTSNAVSRSLSYIIPNGRRGISINVDEVANAGGLVIPGDYVDVVVMYDVEFQSGEDRETAENYLVQTILQNVEVLAVSQTVVDVVPEGETTSKDGQRVRNSEAKPAPEAGTVTLALTPEEAQRVYLAEGNGQIRLAVRPYGDAEVKPVEFMTELELFPRNMPNPFVR